MDITEMERKHITLSKGRIIKNLLILALDCLLAYGSYDGITILQSTINRDESIGVINVALQYACGCITAILFQKYLIQRFGCKVVIVLSTFVFVPYIAANFYPHWVLMVPTSMLVGITGTLFWGANCEYLNDLTSLYVECLLTPAADAKETASDDRPHLQAEGDNEGYGSFHSISKDHTAAYADENGQIVQANIIKSAGDTLKDELSENGAKDRLCSLTNGSLQSECDKVINKSSISVVDKLRLRNIFVRKSKCIDPPPSKILESTIARFFGFHGFISQSCYIWSNLMSYFVLSRGVTDSYINGTICMCGPDFCNVETECFKNNLQEPNETLRFFLTGTFVGITLVAVVMVAFFLEELRTQKVDVSISWESLTATLRHMMCRNQIYLIPLTMYIGLVSGFWMSDFTKAYVGCAWGIHHVALVITWSGVTLALSASVSGWLVKYLGRRCIFVITEAVNMSTIITLFLWQPDSSQKIPFFVVSGLLGIIIGVFWSQLRAFYGILFKSAEEEAFATYQVWHCIGASLAFAYSNFICTSLKIWMLLVVSTVGFIGYLLAERSHAMNNPISLI